MTVDLAVNINNSVAKTHEISRGMKINVPWVLQLETPYTLEINTPLDTRQVFAYSPNLHILSIGLRILGILVFRKKVYKLFSLNKP